MPARIFIIIIFNIFSHIVYAGNVDTISIYSQTMHKEIKCIVITPANYSQSKKSFPAVYLLHGATGNYSSWVIKVPQLALYADIYQCLIICPDGDYTSWYFDSPIDTTMRYETYIGKEVPRFIDAAYRTIADRKHRAISGLSMGGHGAFWIAFHHSWMFGAVSAISGCMDLLQEKGKYDIAKRIGNDSAQWKKHTILYSIDNNSPKDSLHMLFDCGINDYFIESNRKLHEKMLGLHIPHDYIERPGSHTWSYWSNAIPYHLLYFQIFFNSH